MLGSRPDAASGCVELGELCKVLSQRMLDSNCSPRREAHQDTIMETLLQHLPVRLSELGDHLPPRTAVLHFTLLHQSSCSEGYWLASLLRPGDEAPARAWRVPFHPLHENCGRLETLVSEASGKIVGHTLGEAAELLAESRQQLDHVLDGIAGALIPAELRAQIASGAVDRVIIVPEAYLWNLPWPALLLDRSPPASRMSASPPLAVSLLPCLGALRAREKAFSNTSENFRRFGCSLAPAVPWPKNRKVSQSRRAVRTEWTVPF
jgi:hypothetical protein